MEQMQLSRQIECVRIVKVHISRVGSGYVHVFSLSIFLSDMRFTFRTTGISPIQSRQGRRVDSAGGTIHRCVAVVGRTRMCVKSSRVDSRAKTDVQLHEQARLYGRS